MNLFPYFIPHFPEIDLMIITHIFSIKKLLQIVITIPLFFFKPSIFLLHFPIKNDWFKKLRKDYTIVNRKYTNNNKTNKILKF
jgi:hypothetical protein